MSDEMKLLMALCDALGFDVEEVGEINISTGQVLIPHDYKLISRNKPQRGGSIGSGSLMQEIQSIAIKNAKKDLGLD